MCLSTFAVSIGRGSGGEPKAVLCLLCRHKGMEAKTERSEPAATPRPEGRPQKKLMVIVPLILAGFRSLFVPVSLGQKLVWLWLAEGIFQGMPSCRMALF